MENKKSIHFTEIKSFEDAQKATGRPDVPAFTELSEDLREFFQSVYKLVVETEAINGDHKARPVDTSQWKYVPWFWVDKNAPSGFAFHGATYNYSRTIAGYASRLCFVGENDSESRAKAEHAGCTFADDYAAMITK